MLFLALFRYAWHFCILFFAIHLGLLGYLIFISKYIPKILGVLLIVSCLGYLIDALKPFLFPAFNLGFIIITFFGELVFMLWLLIKGSKIPDSVRSEG